MTETFTVTLRGYDRFEVERVFTEVDEALASGSETARAAALEALRKAQFIVVLRGYDIEQVDRAVRERLGGEPSPSPVSPVSFTVVLRGYDMTEVDRVLAQADEARAALTNATFRVRLRGYDRGQVDREIQRRLQES